MHEMKPSTMLTHQQNMMEVEMVRIFVLTLGYTRRGFAHFGGLTAEHLYARPRTARSPAAGGG